ncbi:TRAP transporter large permease [Desertibacillus haloalkaliphilus]|uniref:TRAP transporter large permease n=1 Tax=Desertibacillus haloalkaliphilus TaxID=1328930 RepID=UPI001C26DBAC|nr:TRAP transporter large permease [Desertibacillus haloalkaliphilus]MBU8907975.1 TRAP transporter large permease [Desertibacillus haloalkaliphilus]
MVALTLFGIFFLLLLINVPIAISLATASVSTLLIFDGVRALSSLTDIMYASSAQFTLLAIPFFILAGVIMEHAGISKRLIGFADSLLGHRKGGMALVTVLVAFFFAAISGSGPATVAALGTILIPALVKNGFSKSEASGLLASSGSIGIIIPPSIAFIVFAVVAGDQLPVSIGRLFIAGIIPGILLGVAFLVTAYVLLSRRSRFDTQAHQNAYQPRQKTDVQTILKSFLSAFWGLLMPFIILGGIYGGIFTATEAAVVAVFYGLFVGFFIYRELTIRKLKTVFVDASIQTAVVMFIVASASLFAYIITKENIARDVAAALLNITENQIIILLLINIILIIAGAFIDAISAFYLFVPILIPIMMHLQVDPTAFGVFMTINLAIGLFTPPVGVNLYVACGIAKISLKEITKAVFPFMLAALVVLLLVTFIPEISTFLPDLLNVD